MQVQPEESAIPNVHRVVGGVGVEETPIQHGYLGLGYRQVLPLHESNPGRIPTSINVALVHSCQTR